MNIKLILSTPALIVGLFFVSGLAQASHGGHISGGSYSSKTLRKYSCPNCNTQDHYVSTYTRKNGDVVGGHMQSNSDSTKSDNFTHSGNINPYTGTLGNKN